MPFSNWWWHLKRALSNRNKVKIKNAGKSTLNCSLTISLSSKHSDNFFLYWFVQVSETNNLNGYAASWCRVSFERMYAMEQSYWINKNGISMRNCKIPIFLALCVSVFRLSKKLGQSVKCVHSCVVENLNVVDHRWNCLLSHRNWIQLDKNLVEVLLHLFNNFLFFLSWINVVSMAHWSYQPLFN